MHSRTAICVFVSCLAAIATGRAQQKLTPQSAAAAIRGMSPDREEYPHWTTECDEVQCNLSTDVLRGDSGDPPDRTDHDQYITLTIRVPHKSKTVADLITVDLPPWALKDQGAYLAFVTDPPRDPAAPPDLDADGALPLAIASCDDESCETSIPNGLISAGSRSIDVLDKLLHSSRLIVLYCNEDSKAYRTSIPLDSFHQSWESYKKQKW